MGCSSPLALVSKTFIWTLAGRLGHSDMPQWIELPDCVIRDLCWQMIGPVVRAAVEPDLRIRKDEKGSRDASLDPLSPRWDDLLSPRQVPIQHGPPLCQRFKQRRLEAVDVCEAWCTFCWKTPSQKVQVSIIQLLSLSFWTCLPREDRLWTKALLNSLEYYGFTLCCFLVRRERVAAQDSAAGTVVKTEPNKESATTVPLQYVRAGKPLFLSTAIQSQLAIDIFLWLWWEQGNTKQCKKRHQLNPTQIWVTQASASILVPLSRDWSQHWFRNLIGGPCYFLRNIDGSIICVRLERTDVKMHFSIASSFTQKGQQKQRHVAQSAHTGFSQYWSNVNQWPHYNTWTKRDVCDSEQWVTTFTINTRSSKFLTFFFEHNVTPT